MITDVAAKAKRLTVDVLVGAVFAGGQLLIESPRAPTRRGPIKVIDLEGLYLQIHLIWAARKYNDGWHEDSATKYTLHIPICQYKEGVGADVGVVMVEYPYFDVTMTFYPAGHATNIRREDVKQRP